MTIAPMDQHGPFIPFEKPIPVPGSDATDAPKRSVCFNEEWTPAVIGALKALTRPETWEGAKADIERVSRSAHAILASDQDECADTVYVLDWYPSLGDYLECSNTETFIAGAPLLPLGSIRQPVWWGFSAMTLGNAVMSLAFRDVFDNTFVGGHIKSLVAVCNDLTLTPTWQFTWKDCLGGITAESALGASYVKNNFVCREFCLSALQNFSIILVRDGPILCGSA